jgi:hypothetical protein
MDQQIEESCVESITLLSDGGETTISKLVGRKYGGLDFMNMSNAGCNENYNDFRHVEHYDQRDAYTRHGLERNEDQDPDQDYGAIDIPIKSKNKSCKEESSISSDRSTLSSITNNDIVPTYDDNGHFVAFQSKATQQAEMHVLQQQLLLHHQQSNLTVQYLPMHLCRQPSLANRQTSFQTPPMSNLTVPQLPLQLHQQPSPIKSSRTDTTSTLLNTLDKSLLIRSHNLAGNNFVETQEHVDLMMPAASALAVSRNTINNDRHVGFNACVCCKVGSLIALFAVVVCSATATWFVMTDRVSFVDGKLNINIEKGGNLEQSDPVELSTLTPSLTPRVRISKAGKVGISMFGQSNQNSVSPTQEPSASIFPMQEINLDMHPTIQPNLLDLKPVSKRDNTDSPSQQTRTPKRRPLAKPKIMSPTDGMTLSPSDILVSEESIQPINKPKRSPTSRPVTSNPTNELTPSPFETSAIEEEQTSTPKRLPSLKPIAPSPADEPTPSPSEIEATREPTLNPSDGLNSSKFESSIAAEDMPTETPVIGDVSKTPTASPFNSLIITPPNEVTIPPTYNTPAPNVSDPIVTFLTPLSSPSSAPEINDEDTPNPTDPHVATPTPTHQVELTSEPTPSELDTEEPTESPVVELMTQSPTRSDKQSSNPTDPQITTEATETPVKLMTPPPIPSPAVKESPSPTDLQLTSPSTQSPQDIVIITPVPTPDELDTQKPTESPVVEQMTPSPSVELKTSNPTDPPIIIKTVTSSPTQEVTPAAEDPTESPVVEQMTPSPSVELKTSNPTDPPIIKTVTSSPTQEVTPAAEDPTESPVVEQVTPSPILQTETSSNPTDAPIITPLTDSPTQEVVRMTSSPTPVETNTEDPTESLIELMDTEDPTESPIELMTPLPTPAEDSTPTPTVSETTESTPDPTPYPTFESTQDPTPAQSVLEIITDTPTEEIVDEYEVTLMSTGDGSITSINSYAPTSDDELV